MSTQSLPVERNDAPSQPERPPRVKQPPSAGSARRSNGHSCLAAPRHRWYVSVKAVADFVLSLVLLTIAIPIIALAVLSIKLTSRGPVFYVQTRVGKNGRLFKLYKLRTMVHNAEALTGPVWAGGLDDPRITRVGRLLRNTHIDEFPQLINVLLGQMSLIGPRPERPEFVQRLEWELPEYRQRLFVRPGVTGLAQLQLPADTDLQSVRRKLIHDLYYVRNCSVWLDAKLFAFTAGYLFVTLATSLFKGLWQVIDLPSNEKITVTVEAMTDVESSLFPERRAECR